MRKRTVLKFKNRILNLNTYAGKWVAFIDNQPIACAENLNLLMQKVKKQHLHKEPSVMLIPRKDEGPYILIIQ